MYDQKLIADYFRKCFVSVDGLWFMKVEQDADFEKALELDVAVWEVLPKIQARAVQELLGTGSGIEALRSALEFKLRAERLRCDLSALDNKGFSLHVLECFWVHHIKKSGREQFLDRISAAVCPLEYGVFAREFCPDIHVEHACERCRSDGCCSFCFRQPD